VTNQSCASSDAETIVVRSNPSAGADPPSPFAQSAPARETAPMSAYLITNATVTDQSKIDEYMAAVGATLAGHEFKVLVATSDQEVVEGSPAGERTVVLEFADRAALRSWYDSPEYQAVRGLRLAGTDGFGIIVDGL
jgi:uncharacterized protein (DUF1330 family)